MRHGEEDMLVGGNKDECCQQMDVQMDGCHSSKAEALPSSTRAPEQMGLLSGDAASWSFAPSDHEQGGSRALPKGCAAGIPVFASFPAKPLPAVNSLPSVAMGFVQRDDYHALMELARCGHDQALKEKRRCAFALALKPDGCPSNNLPSTLKVRSANLLHYAVCIGSFHAAAALIVINPELINGSCIVSVNGAEENWCPAELARLFCVLYEGGENDDEVRATSAMFERALKVLELGERDPAQLPCVCLPTLQERMHAAGWNPETAVSAFFAAAEHGRGAV